MLLATLLAAAPWPSAEARLTVLPLPPLVSRLRVAVDAGHGAPGNDGNLGCECQREADETLVEARALAARLRRLGFDVLETRTTAAGRRYPARIAAIERFRPQLVVSLHTDVRADATPRALAADGGVCWGNLTDPGFAVLWSAEGAADVVQGRARWGRAVSQELRAAGFRAYSGADYGSQYTSDEEPACFIDARPPRQRVYFLRATAVAPVVIVETHHALDALEVARWREPETHEAFAAAVASAALKVLENR